MILILVLRAMLWPVPRPLEIRRGKIAPRPRRLPLVEHLRGVVLPPWPNYGISRVRAVVRRR